MAKVIFSVTLSLLMTVQAVRLAVMETEQFQNELTTEIDEEVFPAEAATSLQQAPPPAASWAAKQNKSDKAALKAIRRQNEAGVEDDKLWRQNSPPWESRELKVKIFSWNSGIELKSMKANFDKLFDGSKDPDTADVIITCQQEASYDSDLAETTKDTASVAGWQMISHGIHKGTTKVPILSGGLGNKNAQILRVFVRKTDGSVSSDPDAPLQSLDSFISEDSSDSIDQIAAAGSRLGFSDVGEDQRKKVTLMRESSGVKKPIMKVTMHTHATSPTGKGGVSAVLNWYSDENGDGSRADAGGYRAVFLCAHLDSNSEAVRNTDLKTMMNDFSLIADSPSQTPTSPQYDAFIILGDLNYRLKTTALSLVASGEPKDLLKLLVDDQELGGRQQLALHDPLNAAAAVAAKLIRKTSDANGGFGFECNQPHAKFLPTYKRLKNCEKLNTAILSKGDATTLLSDCYGAIGKKKTERPDEMDFGWLDRVCHRTYRRTTRDSDLLKITTKDDEGWEATPGADEEEPGSDHMPITTIVVLSPNKV